MWAEKIGINMKLKFTRRQLKSKHHFVCLFGVVFDSTFLSHFSITLHLASAFYSDCGLSSFRFNLADINWWLVVTYCPAIECGQQHYIHVTCWNRIRVRISVSVFHRWDEEYRLCKHVILVVARFCMLTNEFALQQFPQSKSCSDIPTEKPILFVIVVKNVSGQRSVFSAWTRQYESVFSRI